MTSEAPHSPASEPARRDDLAIAVRANDAQRFLRALANEHRLAILCELREGELCVADLQTVVGLSQPTLSQHLARLRKERMVKTRRESRTILYSLAEPRVTHILRLVSEIYNDRDCSRSA